MDILRNIEDMPLESARILALGLMIAGAIYCFMGYRFVKLVICLTGFLLAGGAAGVIASLISKGNPTVIAVCVVIGGLAGIWALFSAYRAGVFLTGALAASLPAIAFVDMNQSPWTLLIPPAAGVVGGLAAITLEKPVLRLATSLLGATLLVGGGCLMAYGPRLGPFGSEGENPMVMGGVALAWLVLALMGIWVQFRKGKTPLTGR